MKLAELIRENRELGESLPGPKLNISVLANITVNGIKDILEYELRRTGLNAELRMTDYDNILQEAEEHKNSEALVVFWEACNLVDGLQYKADLFSEEELQALVEKTQAELGFLFQTLASSKLVLVHRFSSLAFNQPLLRKNQFDAVCDQLNAYLDEHLPESFYLLDLDKVLAKVGIENAVDRRFFYSAKALYSPEFFKAYAAHVLPIFRASQGLGKKALILDCDDTLWGGILGEEGLDGIKLASDQPGGAVFEEVQALATHLAKKGVILGLCSKNNPEDVDELLRVKTNMPLQDRWLSIKRVNWRNKVENLQDIADVLNIGLDTLVFVDDSDFEVNLIREYLPEVQTRQVPKNGFEYPQMIRENMGAFFSLTATQEDVKRATMYRAEGERAQVQVQFEKIEEYLTFLELNLEIYIDDHRQIPRLAQLTQKTNQFNLTTTRYTAAEIENLMNCEDRSVYHYVLKDKFGDYGVIGVVICTVPRRPGQDDSAEIDTFLMSCRAMGRQAEFAFFDFLVEDLRGRGVKSLRARYRPTAKNKPVVDFYGSLGFLLENSSESEKNYVLELALYQMSQSNFIQLRVGKE